MVLLTLFLLGGIDQAINPKSKQTIGRRIQLGFTDDEFKRLTTPFGTKRKGGALGLRKVRRKGRTSITF
jgi:hypothetical protein